MKLSRTIYWTKVKVGVLALSISLILALFLTMPKDTKCQPKPLPRLNLLNATVQAELPAVCGLAECADAFLERQQKQQKQGQPKHHIPAIRHIVWKDTKVSQYFIDQLNSWRSLHPNWTYILWRDCDLEPFVRKYFPGAVLQKFLSLPEHGRFSIKRIDMVRYLILYKFGGIYADLDYSLVSNLDKYRQYSAVITREPEAHAAQFYGLKQYPIPIVASPAFFMSSPAHPFFAFAIQQLTRRCSTRILSFAGPFGLTDMLQQYAQVHYRMVHDAEFVYVPNSYSFYPYPNNKLSSSRSKFMHLRYQDLVKHCAKLTAADLKLHKHLQIFCANVDDLNGITDSSHEVVAMHDLMKSEPVYDNDKGSEFTNHMVELRYKAPELKLGSQFI